MHHNHHQSCDADQSHADDVQAHSQPPHRTAEEVERGLVLVQQHLVPGNNSTQSAVRTTSWMSERVIRSDPDLCRKSRPRS